MSITVRNARVAKLETVAERAEELLDGLAEFGADDPYALTAHVDALADALAALRDQPCPVCRRPNRATLAEWARGEPCGGCRQ